MRTCTTMLLLGTFAAAAVGCGRRAAAPAAVPANVAPAPVPAQAVPEAVAKQQEAWLDDSPLRTSMRSMWADCGIILSVAAPRGTQIDHERVECAAEDIHRKATRMAELWNTVQRAVDDCETAANGGDWDTAWQQHTRVWKRCCDCHVETWTFARRGVNPGVVQAWRANDPNAVAQLPEGALGKPEDGPSDPPVKLQMQMLSKHTSAMREALDQESAPSVAKAAKETRAIIQEDVRLWLAIAKEARAIQQLAQGKASEDAREAYQRMTMQCTMCHARSVTSEHDQLTPPAWK